MKCVVDALDFLGLYVLLTKFIGKGEREVKVLASAVGEWKKQLLVTERDRRLHYVMCISV